MGDLLAWFLRFVVDDAYGSAPLSTMDSFMKRMESALNSALISNSSDLATAYNIIKVFGFGILTIYLVMDIADVANGTREFSGISTEALVKCFIRYIIGYLMVDQGLLLCRGMAAVGTLVLDAFRQNGGFTIKGYTKDQLDTLFIAIKTYASHKTFIGSVFGLFGILIPWLIMYIVRVLLSLLILEKIFELFGRIIAAPIALARVFRIGQTGDGFKYLKKIVSLSIQITAVVAIIWTGTQLTVALDNQGGTPVSGFHDAIKEAEENSETIEDQSSGGVVNAASWLGRKAGGLVLTLGYALTGVISDSDGQEQYVNDVNDLFNIDYDHDDMMILNKIEKIGKKGLDSIVNLSTIMFLCAIQFAEIIVAFSLPSIVDAIMGA